MNMIRLLILILAFGLIVTSCWQPPVVGVDDVEETPAPPPDDDDDDDDDDIPGDFDFMLVRNVNLIVDVSFTDGSPYDGAVMELYLDNVCNNADRDDFRVMRFRLDDQGSFRSLVSLPMGQDAVYLCPLSDGLPAVMTADIDKDIDEARVLYETAVLPGNAAVDNFDEFPGDTWRYYNNYYPYKTGWSTLMFEDSWPRFDDFDMNDLVVDYRFTERTNLNNEIVEIIMEFEFRATCAGFDNALGIELPISSTLYNSVEYDRQALFTGEVNQLGNGLEAGHPDNSVVIVTDLIDGLKPKFENCYMGQTLTDPAELQIRINFNTPIAKSDLGVAPYNPFLIAIPTNESFNTWRGMEVHLPNFPPTARADLSVLGTEDDNSSIAAGRYYIGNNRLNWGLNVPRRMDAYPQIETSIEDAFLRFRDWAESGGQEYFDWFENKPGYRDNSVLIQWN